MAFLMAHPVYRDLSGSSPEGVVVDATARLLFYTDNGRNTINVARTDNSQDHLILISYAKHPRTIQIDPMRRSLSHRCASSFSFAKPLETQMALTSRYNRIIIGDMSLYSGCTMASGVVVVVGVCNRSQMRTSECTCLILV